MEESKEKVGVLLFNMGGPETLDDVEPFLMNLFSDPDIMDLPPMIGKFLPRLIAKRRAPKSRTYYEAIGGGSPLRSITESQASQLEKALNAEPQSNRLYRVVIAMRYAPPRLNDSLDHLLAFRPEQLVLLPLYPQRSTTTTRSSFREFKMHGLKKINLPPEKIHVVSAFPEYPPYIESLAETVQNAISRIPETGQPIDVLFSAHGIPEKRIATGDPYRLDTETTVREVSHYLSAHSKGQHLRFHLAYQSRVGPLKWLGPETKATIKSLAKEYRCMNLILVPVSFVSDHQETLFEMDITYRNLAHSSRILHFERASSLNLQETFIKALSQLTIDALNHRFAQGAPCLCNCGICPKR